MKIPLIILPKFKKLLIIEKKYNSQNLIIPVGSDCHPAHSLQKLNIRTESFPFDWLNTNPLLGLTFVEHNIRNNFKYFISDLAVNEKGQIVSKTYPYAEFVHEKDLIDNRITAIKIKKRITRFMDSYNSRNCIFLYNIPSTCLEDIKSLKAFLHSVISFANFIKKNDKLAIYIRYDESCDENKLHCDELYNELHLLKNVSITKYIRKLEKYGIWGDEKGYPKLFANLGLNINLTFPRIYIR